MGGDLFLLNVRLQHVKERDSVQAFASPPDPRCAKVVVLPLVFNIFEGVYPSLL
jgi:hypothetical protein